MSLLFSMVAVPVHIHTNSVFGKIILWLECVCVKVSVLSGSFDPMGEKKPLPDSSVHGILQVRILECVAFPFSRGSSQPRD